MNVFRRFLESIYYRTRDAIRRTEYRFWEWCEVELTAPIWDNKTYLFLIGWLIGGALCVTFHPAVSIAVPLAVYALARLVERGLD